MTGESLPQAEPTAPHYLSLAADHGVHVEISRATVNASTRRNRRRTAGDW